MTALDQLLAEVSGERMGATVATLAGDAFAGRRVGTLGGAAARAWLSRHLQGIGATVATETFSVRAVPEIYAVPTAEWNDGPLAFGRDFTLHLASADTGQSRRGSLGVAGADDPAGRWLLVPAAMTLSEAYLHADGALGLLVGRAVDGDGWHFTMLAGPNPGPLPLLSVATGLWERLFDAAGESFSANTPIRRIDVTGTNIHGRLRTAAPGGADLLLTAHYDGVGDYPGLRQSAAADNGSGVAVVCEAARIIAAGLPAEVGLSVALVDGEETGALGSAHHAAQLSTRNDRPLVINVDGAGCLHEAAAIEAGGPAHGILAVLDQAARHTGLPLTAGPVASDNRRYAAAGLAAIGIGAGMAGYHSPADTADRVEPATMVAICRLVVATGWLAGADATKLSSLIGDRR
ncbi:Peptidase family M28 [Asanoa ishikariensis]|uniref:Peptidase family M28 n=1 Tax=Asanoa ishikariensis TaxID=137265 RepID=A0A1H3MUA2_9ACTN|nr:M28 family peptidase [Asanoa ishikariensis]SDY80028.1 Peptidase family M28 [Asanoa ishikariensis]